MKIIIVNYPSTQENLNPNSKLISINQLKPTFTEFNSISNNFNDILSPGNILNFNTYKLLKTIY
jgi:hypothetical protein